MKLTYRGVKYQSQTPIPETTESEIGGKYRGVNFKFRQKKAIFIPHSSLRLKYRGVTHLAFGRSWHRLQLNDLTCSGQSSI
ncbi:DUF4278 domain-containing protein [Lyngbya aestuarii]|uniref:DUF4278 domain-containing protein n=1 Tax=Lyngbya aestuarii TaxID=118322 RepID=UPI00403DEF69